MGAGVAARGVARGVELWRSFSRDAAEGFLQPASTSWIAATQVGLMRSAAALQRVLYGGPTRGRVAMFHVGRCGSTVLGDALAQHRGVHWAGELFNPYTVEAAGCSARRDWAQAVVELGAHQRRCEYFGFETMMLQLGPHCLGMTIEEYVRFLQQAGFTRYIVLSRRNLLRVVISAVAAAHAKSWHRAAKAPSKPQPLRLDPAEPWGAWAGSLVNVLQALERFYADFEEPLRGLARLDLVYEDDIQHDLGVAYRKVCDFLEMPPQPFEVRLSPTNPYRVKEMLSNFGEVAGALAGTRFEWMLAA